MPLPLDNALCVRSLRSITAAMLVASFAGSGVAIAQSPRSATEQPQSETEREAEAADIEQAASDLLVRTVLRRSRILPNPTIADYRLTALGLRLARLVVPDDAELLRNEIEAWTAADDAARVMSSTRELIRLDPRDTIAQLRLIDTQIRRLNTAEERLSAYDRLLGPAGSKLRATIRSRLAFDAAQLAKEGGDYNSYLRLLTESTLLDSTNQNAAVLYATELLPVAQTRVERFELRANILQADPLDPIAYENVAIELMSHGAYEATLRYLDRMRDLLGNEGRDFMSRSYLTDTGLFDENRTIDYLIAAWQHRGASEAISFINDAQGHTENRFASEIRRIQQQGASEAQVQQVLAEQQFPWLPYQLEQMRALMLVGQSEDVRSDLAFTNRPMVRDRFSKTTDPFGIEGYIEPDPVSAELRRAVAAEFPEAENATIEETAMERARRSRKIDPLHEAITRYLLSTGDFMARLEASGQIDDRTTTQFELKFTLESVWLLLVAERSVDLAEARFNNLVESLGEDALEQGAVARYRGWIAANRGDFETARETLTPLAETDSSALYALAMTELRSGNTQAAERLLSRLRQQFPQTALACVARDRLEAITGDVPRVLNESDEVNRYAMRFAPWLERMTRSPREFMSLSVRPTKTTLGVLDRHELVLELTNTSGRPLAVGPNSPINSRFLFTPRIEFGGRSFLDLRRERVTEAARQTLGLADGAPFPIEYQEQLDLVLSQEVSESSRTLLEVVDIDRVLRLEPNETVRVTVWGGRGNAGQFIDRDPTERVTIDWSVAQGFVQTQRTASGGRPTQALAAGPMSLSTQVSPALRVKLPDLSSELLAERLLNSSGMQLVQTIVQSSAVMLRGAEGTEALRAALLERLPRMSDAQLAYTALRLSEIGILVADQDLENALRDHIRSRIGVDADLSLPQTQLLAVASMIALVRVPDDPIVRLSRESSQADLAEFSLVIAQMMGDDGLGTGPEQPEFNPESEDADPVYEIDGDMLAPGK